MTAENSGGALPPHPAESVALWCVVNKNQILVQRSASVSLDRAVWHLPRLAMAPDSLALRREIDARLGHAGLSSVRRPMVSLGAIHSGQPANGELVHLHALALDEPGPGSLPPAFALFPLSKPHPDGGGAAEERRFPLVDSLVWAGAQIYFSLPESRGCPKDYEVFGSLALHLLKDDYINLWYPDASRDLGRLGLQVAIDVVDQQPTLKLTGRQALLEEDIFLVRSRMLDLARHAKGRLWITEIIDGEETVLDFADPSVIGILSLGSMG